MNSAVAGNRSISMVSTIADKAGGKKERLLGSEGVKRWCLKGKMGEVMEVIWK